MPPKEPPAPFPPAPPREPFLRLRTPREGTLLGLQVPALQVPAAAAPEAVPGAASPYLEREIAELRRELAGFRALITRAARAAQPSPPAPGATPPPLPAWARPRRRALRQQALAGALGVLLALGLALVSAAAALTLPDYARFVARAARLGAPPAPGALR